MNPLPRAHLWNRLDTDGTDLALFDDHADRLLARGVVTAADPQPHTCGYELATAAGFATSRLTVTVEGAGWWRQVRMERGVDGWRVTTSEQGSGLTTDLPGIEEPDRLYDALDVDLEATPLTNTLPIRRLGLLDAAPGTEHTITVAWMRVPSLQVMPAEQTYTAIAPGVVRYSFGRFTAHLIVGADGFVAHYPGYARRTDGRH